ncbi:MAG: DUF3842 family protein [Defluviitaleaceae bacterium]|nr:DUF3842 family protein [Defluviitaleaceae bacterium]
MKILIIDGQGGGLGAQIVTAIIKNFPTYSVRAVGTNNSATVAMIKAGAKEAATGENAVVVACRTADIIIGPVGIAIADALLGEVTPTMAVAVGQSRAKRLLIPINQCDNTIVGAANLPVNKLLQQVVEFVGDCHV